MPTHTVEIKFSIVGRNTLIFTGPLTYRSSITTSDTLSIFSKSALIETSRSSSQENPLEKHNSTFYKQIIKALCLYYLIEQRPNQIREIILTQRRGTASERRIITTKANIRQVVARSTDLSVLANVNSNQAEALLNETSVGRSVLYASTHLIKSLDSGNPFDRFEKLWRAFNALYKAFAKENSEIDCHIKLRDHIKNNPGLFPISLAKVSTLITTDIRTKIRWNQMILNNHATQAKTRALKESILRNSDPRILEIYRQTLPIRETFLRATGDYNTVEAHINNGITAGVACDPDVLSTLCIKYMYFVRNKIAHAEKTDHGFSFIHGSAEEAEIRWLTPFLESLVIDLINLNSTF